MTLSSNRGTISADSRLALMDRHDGTHWCLMPILPAEPELYPEQLLAVPAEPVAGHRWWTLHTKPRQEKSLARWLSATGSAFYLPTIDRKTRIRGRVLTSRIPLFTGYVFIYADHANRVAALTTNRVVRCLEVHDQDRFWHDLRQVRTMITSGLPLTPEERLAPGVPVEITSGPLEGMTGEVIRTATGRRFVVSVNFIQKGASVLVEDFALKALGPARDLDDC